MKSKELGQIKIELISVFDFCLVVGFIPEERRKISNLFDNFDKVDNRNRWSLNVPILMMIIYAPVNLLSKSLTVGR